MKTPPKPANERKRLQTLDRLGILDTPRDAVFDGITRAIADFCEVPIALVSLVDADRQWFKSTSGLAVSETSRDDAFCAHAILEPSELMEVPDATLDERFYDSPLVVDEPHVRFYAGMPLKTTDGSALGALCVIDNKPRVLTLQQRRTLERLSRVIVALIERMEHRAAPVFDQIITRAVQHGIVITDPTLPDNPVIFCNQVTEKMTGYHAAEIIGKNCRMFQGVDTDPTHVSQLRRAITVEESCSVTLKNYKKDGTEFWNEMAISPARNLGGGV
ncbi:MAG: PAS domain-containing protein, partial [Pseudomonadales bacterium]